MADKKGLCPQKMLASKRVAIRGSAMVFQHKMVDVSTLWLNEILQFERGGEQEPGFRRCRFWETELSSPPCSFLQSVQEPWSLSFSLRCGL